MRPILSALLFFALFPVFALARTAPEYKAPIPAAARPVVAPKCWGVVTTVNGVRTLICQNPCIGGVGCAKVGGTIPGYEGTFETCRCQGGAYNCCDVWFDGTTEIASGDCGNGCPSSGHCSGYEAGGGDFAAHCIGGS